MRRLLVTGSVTALIYAVVSMAIVWISRVSGEPFGVPVVAYVGPGVYFIAISVVNRSAFGSLGDGVLRWVAVLGACAAMTAVFSFLVFVLAVNVYLALGGRI